MSMAKVRTRLDGVDHIFLDEVSILSCHDLYNISAELANAQLRLSTSLVV